MSIYHIIRAEDGNWELWYDGRVIGSYRLKADALDAEITDRARRNPNFDWDTSKA
jgi:hypothetical protein